MANTDDEDYLADLYVARRATSTALRDGVPVEEYYIGNRRVRKPSATAFLEYINSEIIRMNNLLGTAPQGRQRNLIQKKRRG